MTVSTHHHLRNGDFVANAVFAAAAELGIESLLDRPLGTLSGGEQQRVAVARALVTRPEILIADEPTSALDSDNREAFMNRMLQMAAENCTTVIFVSHDRSLQDHFDRHLDMNVLTAQGGTT